MSRVVKLLRDLIAVPSVNPAFCPSGDKRAGERRVAELAAARAARDGLDVALEFVSADRPNLVAVLQPRGEVKHRIMLAPHLDTVGGLSDSIFKPVRRGDRLYGRGSCDTKGSVAAMLTAVGNLARGGRRPGHTEIRFVGLIDEENGQLGSRSLARLPRSATIDLAIVGEPTRLKVVTAHKGDVWLELVTRGRAAHGAQPELGINAVLKMVKVLQILETRYTALLRRRVHPLLGSPTLNVGTISGGAQPNIVPNECAIRIDRRTLPGETLHSVQTELRDLFEHADLAVEINDLRHADCPALETDVGQPLVRQLMRTARQRKPVGVHYFCDAAILAQIGVPSVVFGPGDIAQAHTVDEWVSIPQVERAAELLTDFLRKLP